MVATAILFHHRVQDHLPTQSPVGFDGDWPPASATACTEQDTAINAYREAWRAILAVDYRPVFETGRAALAALPADPDTGQAVRHLAEVVARVSERVSGLRHDLLGRIFHRVLDTARYDGSFYTSTAAAVLLASLAIREQDADWSDPNSVAALPICDPACGTGTLLGVFNGIPYLGSLDFLSGQARLAAWPSATQQVESQQGTAEPPPPMDLVIMNPPFTRDSLRHDQLSSRVKLNSRRQTESQGMTMTTDKEQEAFSLVVERHKNGSSENDIRTAFQRFMETAGIAAASEMTTEGPPGLGNPGRMDLYVHNTCIEFKKNIVRNGVPISADIAQLDGYLKNLLKNGAGVRNGILTDGVHYFLRRVGEEDLPIQRQAATHFYDRAEQAPRLREFLHRIISAPAENISPTAENLERQFGSESDAFLAGNLLLKEAYEAHRDDPTVAVKRRLWQDLLQVALGKDAATAGDESDWLFIRHTYITSLIAVIMQQQLLGDVARYASERPDALLKGHILAEQSDLHGVVDADLFTWPTEVGESTYLREIARVAEQFDWTEDAKEVAPTLYQNVITQEERKRLGEYYTPRWLAKEITQTVVDDPLNQRVMDPSCGSGTFIETAVEHILNHSGCLSQTETLKKLQENIVGIDIHPVAVQLSKATWVMAAADTIRGARAEGNETGSVSAPHLPGRLHAATLRHRHSLCQPIHRTGDP